MTHEESMNRAKEDAHSGAFSNRKGSVFMLDKKLERLQQQRLNAARNLAEAITLLCDGQEKDAAFAVARALSWFDDAYVQKQVSSDLSAASGRM